MGQSSKRSSDLIETNFGRIVERGSVQNLLNFGANPDQWVITGIVFVNDSFYTRG